MVEEAVNERVNLPHRFDIHHPLGSGHIIIVGPQRYKEDLDALGIRIRPVIEHVFVNVHPFEEFEENRTFNVADPDMLDELIDYVNWSIETWLCWHDVFRDDGLIPEGLC